MKQLLSVYTHFVDLSELAQGLMERVEPERLILYGPTSYSVGTVLGFAIFFGDGRVAVEGIGEVSASVDGGNERDPAARFDVVLDAVRFEKREQEEAFRELLRFRRAWGASTEDEIFGEQEHPDRDVQSSMSTSGTQAVAGAEVLDASPARNRQPHVTPAGYEPRAEWPQPSTDEIDVGDVEDEEISAVSSAPPPQAPARPDATPAPPFQYNMGILERPMHAPSWWPQPQASPHPRASTGLFEYPSGRLPIPNIPPRPAEEVHAVSPAPKPRNQR